MQDIINTLTYFEPTPIPSFGGVPSFWLGKPKVYHARGVAGWVGLYTLPYLRNYVLRLGLMVVIGLSTQVFAGTLEAPAGPDSPDSAMYSIEAIYQRLSTGTNIAKRGEGFRGQQRRLGAPRTI